MLNLKTIIKKVSAIVLIMCLILNNFNFAETIHEKTTVSNETKIEESVNEKEEKEEQITEEETTSQFDIENEKDSDEKEALDKISNDEEKEESKEEQTQENVEVIYDDSIIDEELELSDVFSQHDEYIEVDNNNKSFMEDIEEDISTQSEAVVFNAPKQIKSYTVKYNFVYPKDAEQRGAYWYQDSFLVDREREAYYMMNCQYDEEGPYYNLTYPASAPRAGFFHSVNYFDILDGYELVGWNDNEEDAKKGIAKYDVNPVKKGHLTDVSGSKLNLYSVFKLLDITIKFDINDASKQNGTTYANIQTLNDKTVHIGDVMSFLNDKEYSTDIKREGYDFIGWSRYNTGILWNPRNHVSKEYFDKHYSVKTISADTKFSRRVVTTTRFTGSHLRKGNEYKLYAVWQPKEYKVYFHWPSFGEKEKTYDQYLEGCKNAIAIEQWMVFDNTWETMQELHKIKGKVAPNRNLTYSMIPSKYFMGMGTDANCTDKSTILWNEHMTWTYDVKDGEELHLYMILSEDTEKDFVQVKIDFDGGYLPIGGGVGDIGGNVFKQPIGSTYQHNIGNALLSMLEKPGYTYDKLINVETGEEFDLTKIASANDKKQLVIDKINKRNELAEQVASLYEMYRTKMIVFNEKINEVMDSKMLTREEALNDNDVISSKNEAEDALYAYNDKYDEYLDIVGKDIDISLKVVWRGKELKGIFDYNGLWGNSHKVTESSKTMQYKMVRYGEAIGELPVPEKTGYEFVGWYTGRFINDKTTWKKVDENTVFKGAEQNDIINTENNTDLIGFNYDELQFYFYAEYKPKTVNVKIAENENSNVKINSEFKFGEPTVLDIQGKRKKNADSFSIFDIFGAGEDEYEEVTGIKVLEDYVSDQDNATLVHKGTEFYNGDKVILFGKEGEEVDIALVWGTPNDSGNDDTNPTEQNPTEQQPTEAKPTEPEQTEAKPTEPQTNPSVEPIKESSQDNSKESTNETNAETKPVAPQETTAQTVKASTPQRTGGDGGGDGTRLAISTLQNTNQNTKSLQQSISQGSFLKAQVNTRSLNIKSVNQATSRWEKDTQTGKWKLSGTNELGQQVTPTNTFCQVRHNITNNEQVVDTYYFDQQGNMVTGWMQTQDNKWYYFNDQQNANEGKMAIGWNKVANDWYYFTANGSMLTNGTTPDGYKIDQSGVWKTA